MELGPNGGLLYSRRRAGVRKGAGAAVGGVSLPHGGEEQEEKA